MSKYQKLVNEFCFMWTEQCRWNCITIKDERSWAFVKPGFEVIKLFSCSTQLSMNFVLFMNLKILTKFETSFMLNSAEQLGPRFSGKCRVLHLSAFIFVGFPFDHWVLYGILENRLSRCYGMYAALQNIILSYEVSQCNRDSDFRSFMCCFLGQLF